MASPVGNSYSGRKNVGIIGGKSLRKNVTIASCTQANTVSGAAVSGSGTSTHSITVSNVSQYNGVSSVYLLGEVIPAGEWTQLTVASHQRRLSLPQGAANVGYDPAPMVASEAITPSAVSAVPFRGYSITVKGSHNTIMVDGSGHGAGYAGNEIDKILMPQGSATQIVTTIPYQPVVSPSGPFSNWGSGGGGYIHKQSYAPSELVGYDDQTEAANWQPYTRHNYTNASWNPYWGYTFFSAFAKQSSYPDGTYTITGGVLQSSDAQPTSETSTGWGGIVAFHEDIGKFKTYIDLEAQGWNWRTVIGMSDWNNWREELLICCVYTDSFQILAWQPVQGLVKRADLTVSPTDPVLTNCAITGIGAAGGNNGVLIRHMEIGKYLILRQVSLGGRAGIGMFIYSEDFGTRQNRIVDITSSLPGSASGEPFYGVSESIDPLSFCIDKNSRRIFWLIYPGAGSPLRFYRSTFDDPMVWTQLSITPGITINSNEYLSLDRQPFHFMNGYLYIHDDSANDPAGMVGSKNSFNFKKAKVDNGEDLPSMSFQRFNYYDQDFRHTGYPSLSYLSSKHTNWAKRTSTGDHICCAGDHGTAYNAGMAKLVFDETSRGYTFTEELGEVEALSAALGKYRPMGPDDGGWAYSSSSNPNPAFRDKFIFMRGGDGVAWNSCAELKNAYAPYADDYDQWMNSGGYWDDGAIGKMLEDGWTEERLLVYNPDGKYFSLLGAQNWTWDSGGAPNGHPITTLGSASARNGCFDEATNCVFRITMFSGGAWLVKYDLTNQAIKGWPIGNWVDTNGLVGTAGRTWFFGEGLPPTPEDVISNGFGYYNTVSSRWASDIPGHWEHKATWINQVDGKLYAVAPTTGYLWCFETRGTETAPSNDGRRIPFYPVGNRIPLVGCFPPMAPEKFPSVVYTDPSSVNNGSISMNSFLVPYKGGLLWWSNSHFTRGVFGHPINAFWRRLDNTGDWTVVTFPQEFAAQMYSIDNSTINNAEVVFPGGGGALEQYATKCSYFWKMT